MDKGEVMVQEQTNQQTTDISQDAREDWEASYDDMTRLYEETLRDIQEGEVVKGTVVKITPDYVLVDVGYKSEGQIPIEEFQNDEGDISVQENDQIEVLLERREDEDGLVVLSKSKADQARVWDIIGKAYDNNQLIEGKVISRIKGGLSVDIGVRAFLPGSQIDLHPVRDMDRMIGQVFKFKILKYNKKRGNIVISRRAILEEEREHLRSDTLKKLEEGSIVDGTIKNITDYGVFIDLGGVDGLLHITDMSWGRVNHPSELFTLGETIKVKVIGMDKEKGRVSLGFKQLSPDPWTNAEEKYPVGKRVKGKVVSLTNYGIFVELEKGIEGLIHISEISWIKKIRHPSQVVSMGEEVEGVVLSVDSAKRRISLGIKQLEPNPWTIVREKYPVGTVIEGTIKNITDFGLFVGLDEGIDGLVHISDLSWFKKIKHPGELYKKGQKIQAIVLNIDEKNERFSLGVKQLEKDPWEGISYKYHSGQIVEGKVTNITDFGIFLELDEGIEGLIHISEIDRQKSGKLSDFAKPGDRLRALIINLDERDRKIGLSLKELDEENEKSEVASYMAQQGRQGTSLGEILEQKDSARSEAAESNASSSPEPAEEPASPSPEDAPETTSDKPENQA
ncbi:MAG TPA: 30S ribosomal protein S1 [Thermodesulfobacteriota bacterium]|nr:30S ribosomal protein S1 [Thermodesulfobacteriota bacterium]HNU73047.1 30S ribosomal protein S1 [Thermodesulfobacteriota bacterium]